MLIKAGNQIFDPNIVPCMIVLTKTDKDNISRMFPEATRYCAYPDSFSADQIEQWMADPRLPKAHEGPADAITGGPPCTDKDLADQNTA